MEFDPDAKFEFPQNRSMVMDLFLPLARYYGKCDIFNVVPPEDADYQLNLLCAAMQSDRLVDSCVAVAKGANFLIQSICKP